MSTGASPALAETVTNYEKCTPEWHEKCTTEIFREGGNAIGETQNAETRHDAAFVNG